MNFVIPNIQNSVFAHIVHVLLVGGVVVYSWGAISCFVRKPTRVFDGVQKAVRAAWLAVLFLVLTQPNPLPYLKAGALVFAAMVVLGVLARRGEPARDERDEYSAIAR